MNIIAWLYGKFHKEEEREGEDALIEARETLEKERRTLREARELANRSRRSRERNGYGEALRKSLGGR